MKKHTYVLAFLIAGFLLAGNAYGEDEVYYCAEIDSNGFLYDKKSGSYVPTRFTTEKFKIKFDKVLNTLVVRDEYLSNHDNILPVKYHCNDVIIGNPHLFSCDHNFSRGTFSLNTKSGRFVRSVNAGYYNSGELFVDGKQIDLPISISYGKCDKF